MFYFANHDKFIHAYGYQTFIAPELHSQWIKNRVNDNTVQSTESKTSMVEKGK